MSTVQSLRVMTQNRSGRKGRTVPRTDKNKKSLYLTDDQLAELQRIGGLEFPNLTLPMYMVEVLQLHILEFQQAELLGTTHVDLWRRVVIDWEAAESKIESLRSALAAFGPMLESLRDQWQAVLSVLDEAAPGRARELQRKMDRETGHLCDQIDLIETQLNQVEADLNKLQQPVDGPEQ